ncbi:monocarboxylate transporter 5-like [Dermacentor silvarum]|uniref:monocarboxylate transporter 5-like n=1 Tax=Dermacentor silvarum TaxID=543639 RepID=UPI002101923D|nr:monocarboxylate transporter 5-like [Dermacentor silvarum]
MSMDSSRSWVVAAACFWINAFAFSMVRSAAVVYVALLHAFPVARERASWPSNLSVVCYFFTGPIAGVLARYIPIWKLSVVGCLGGSLAICACFFAPSMLFLDVFLGFVYGTSIGLLSLFGVVVNQHFLKHRAAASGIANAGFTVGGLVFPPVMKALEEKYGIHGTFLIFGATMLNSVAGALLQRTPPVAQPERDITGASTHGSDGSDVLKNGDEFGEPLRCYDYPHQLDDADLCGCNGTPDKCCQKLHLLTIEGYDVDDDQPKREEAKLGSTVSTDFNHSKGHVYFPAEEDAVPELVANNGIQKPLNGGPKSAKRDHFLSFLLLPEYYLIAFSFSIMSFNTMTYYTVVVDFGVDRGIPAWNAVYLMSFYSIIDLLARLGSGWITDRKYLRKSTMMGSHLALWGASLCLIPLCSSYLSQVCLSVLLGWCNGSTVILTVVLFMELVGIEKIGVCFGSANALAGLVELTKPLLIGFFRDTHKDYSGLFSLIGGMTVCVSLLWLYYRVREQCSPTRKDGHLSRMCSKLSDRVLAS